MEDKCIADIDDTIKYYDYNAETFVESTINVDVSALYKPFEELLQYGAKILDLGCGNGRDSKYFAQQGYNVIAVDPSQAMCEQTRIYARVPVYRMKAEEMQFSNEFDAVWACASLLHVAWSKQEKVLGLIGKALKKNGVCYCSWKYGNEERNDNGRRFTDCSEESLKILLKQVNIFEIISIWKTNDIRTDKNQIWLNTLLKKR